MGHNGSPYDDVIHVALIARSRVTNYQLTNSSDFLVYIPGRWQSHVEIRVYNLQFLRETIT